jgi:hypothetical protein
MGGENDPYAIVTYNSTSNSYTKQNATFIRPRKFDACAMLINALGETLVAVVSVYSGKSQRKISYQTKLM